MNISAVANAVAQQTMLPLAPFNKLDCVLRCMFIACRKMDGLEEPVAALEAAIKYFQMKQDSTTATLLGAASRFPFAMCFGVPSDL